MAALLSLPLRSDALDTELAFPSLSFFRPVDIQHPPDGTDRLVVVEQPGRVRIFENDPATSTTTLFLDIEDRVLSDARFGLLGLAFHPDYTTNGYLFVHYTAAGPDRSVIARFTVSADPDVVDPASEVVLLEVEQPHNFHNGGQLAFGPDGTLYIPLGDGGPYDGTPDPDGNGQNRATLLGSILRIDVDDPDPGLAYGIPDDNPFVGNPDGWREEIWAWGIRNTWRMSHDPVTDRWWGGENGENLWEEVNLLESGRNYGWTIMEGEGCHGGGGCDMTGLALPLHVYGGVLSPRRSVIGGYVYRGSLVPELQGTYVFGDFIQGMIWSLAYDGVSDPVVTAVGARTNLSTFGVDAAGELLFADWINGRIHRFTSTAVAVEEPASPVSPVTFRLGDPRPNPFTPRTEIPFEVDGTVRARLEIFDVAGRAVRTLLDARIAAGHHEHIWDGTDQAGAPVASGTYLVRLTVDGNPVVRRLVLIR